MHDQDRMQKKVQIGTRRYMFKIGLVLLIYSYLLRPKIRQIQIQKISPWPSRRDERSHEQVSVAARSGQGGRQRVQAIMRWNQGQTVHRSEVIDNEEKTDLNTDIQTENLKKSLQ